MSGTIFAASWQDGLFVITGDAVSHECAEQPVRGLHADRGTILAIVGAHTLRRRLDDGRWQTLATSDASLSCAVSVGDDVFVGTDDAQVLRLTHSETLEPLPAFAHTPGRDQWYAGTAVIDGRVIGPPLGVRSIAATCDGQALLVNVHVGGIPRSTDRGASWRPTLDLNWDVHQVAAHPSRPEVLAAASGAGLCLSHDQGRTWTLNRDGLHAPYCASVAFCGDDVFVSAANDHFATVGALYRMAWQTPGALQPVEIGGTQWLGGIADTECLQVSGRRVALVDRSGQLHVSEDAGHSWHTHSQRLRMTSSLLLG